MLGYHLPNMKISAILLISLLVYDIFFVFITPMLTEGGKSVMIQVCLWLYVFPLPPEDM